MVASDKHHSNNKRKAVGSFNKGSKFDKHKKSKTTEDDGGETKSSTALKRELKKERQSHRRHAETVVEAKVLWNKLRLKTNTPKEIESLMKDIMKLVREKISEIALQHDASRVVQAAIQFGNAKQRKEVLTELCDNKSALGGLPELSKIQYSHFCTLKLLKYCNRDHESMEMIVKSFKGSIPKLAVHAVGAKVIESLFLNLPSKYTNSLKQEFYGPHFSLFSTVDDSKKKKNKTSKTPTLQSNLALSTTTKTQRDGAISFLKDIITKGLAKSFFGYTYFQELLAEYMDVIPADEKRTMTSSIVDHSIHLLSTRQGSKVAAICASYATPKDRKRMMKALKGYARQTLLHKDAYLALLRLIQVTDDTVSISKSVLAELLTDKENNDNVIIDKTKTPSETKIQTSPLLDLALDETASKLFLLLLVEDDAARIKYFDPYERSILAPETKPMIDGVSTSKKDDTQRRKELLKNFHQALLDLCTKHPLELIQSVPGSRILKEVYAHASTNDIEPVVTSVMEVCTSSVGDDKEEADENGSEDSYSLFEDHLGHRVVKNLILCDVDKEDAPFSKSFVEKLGNQCLDVAKSSRGAFVVAALFKVPGVRDDLIANLKPCQKQLEKLSRQKEGSTAGYTALLKEITNTEK